MSDLSTYTVCGLRVVPGRRPEDWTCFSTVTRPVLDAFQAADLAQLDAVADLSTQALPEACTDLAFAAVHNGEVPIVGELNRATDPVTPDQYDAELRRAQRQNLPVKVFTVCGIDRHSFATLCIHQPAMTWMLAWVDAEERARQCGASLLTARVHPVEADPIGPGFDYADRLAGDDAEMKLTAMEKWGVKWLAR